MVMGEFNDCCENTFKHFTTNDYEVAVTTSTSQK